MSGKLIAVARGSGRNRKVLVRRLWHQVLGLVFLIVVALFIGGTIAVYNKAFADIVPVRLEVQRAGSQMSVGADVKVRGVIVGRVSAIEAMPGGAALKLALKPSKVDEIPTDVRARILPKTLFGQRYVSLRIPENPAGAHLEAGDVIQQDRSKTAIELQKVLTDVVPLLKAVQPQKLASTLNAVAGALEGRGEQLGDTLARVSKLLGEVNESLPDIKADISKFADVTEIYDKAAPDLLRALSDLTTTTRTILEKRADLRRLYASVIGVSTDLRRFLAVNKQNLIDLTAAAQPTLDVLAKYAPEYPCLLRQIAQSIPNARKAFGAGTEHPESSRVLIEFIPGRGAYEPGIDEHINGDHRGPRCYPLPENPRENHFPQYPPGGPVEDGARKPPAPGPPDRDLPKPVKGLQAPFKPGVWSDGGGGSGLLAGGAAPRIANSPAEQRLISVLVAPQLGVPARSVPGWSSLLVGPLYRGKEVVLK